MTQIKLIAKSFKRMEDPNASSEGHTKYVCYVKANSIPQEMNNWFATNPREQKMTTNVARKITESLRENSNFHELSFICFFSSILLEMMLYASTISRCLSIGGI